ncbi:MAG: hypothetical protein ABIG95_04105 [Candidatus Woesearchaeota archaeon]
MVNEITKILELMDPETHRGLPSYTKIKMLCEQVAEERTALRREMLRVRSIKYDSGSRGGQTSIGRTVASQTVIESLNPKHVLEIGLGKCGPTYLELVKAGEEYGFMVEGVEVDLECADGLPGVILGDILSTGPQICEAVGRADVIRSANTVIPYFPGTLYMCTRELEKCNEELPQFFGTMERFMREGAYLLITHCHSSPNVFGEEGFLYKKKGKLVPLDFVFSLWFRGDSLIWNGHSMYRIMRGGLDKMLIVEPLKEQGYRCYESLWGMNINADEQERPELYAWLQKYQGAPAPNAMEIVIEAIRQRGMKAFYAGGMIGIDFQDLVAFASGFPDDKFIREPECDPLLDQP